MKRGFFKRDSPKFPQSFIDYTSFLKTVFNQPYRQLQGVTEKLSLYRNFNTRFVISKNKDVEKNIWILDISACFCSRSKTSREACNIARAACYITCMGASIPACDRTCGPASIRARALACWHTGVPCCLACNYHTVCATISIYVITSRNITLHVVSLFSCISKGIKSSGQKIHLAAGLFHPIPVEGSIHWMTGCYIGYCEEYHDDSQCSSHYLLVHVVTSFLFYGKIRI